MATQTEIVMKDVTFTATDIRSCSVVEDFHPLSITVPVNTLDLTLFSTTGGFTIINPSGVYEPLLTRQPMAVYEIIDGIRHFIGKFYMDEWENSGENLISFTCVDVLGLLDKTNYMGGLWMEPIKAGLILDDIFRQTGLDVIIDPQVYNTELTGWLPILSCREAVQQVCFAAGAYVRSSRQDTIKIGVMGFVTMRSAGIRSGVAAAGQSRTYQMRWRGNTVSSLAGTGIATTGIRSGVANAGQSRVYQKRWRKSQWEGTEYTREISSQEQSIDRRLTLRPKVTGVEVSMHDILPGDGERKLFEGVLSAGSHTIEFRQPMHTLDVDGADITESHANYAVLDVATPGEVVLIGLVYDDMISTYAVSTTLAPNEKPNVVKIEDATLVNSSNGREIAQKMFDYYQQRYLQNMRMFGSTISAGNNVRVETLYGNLLYGVVEHAEIDLAGGSIVKSDVVGVIV